MAVSQRDSEYHTYSDYLLWSRDHGDELIDGAAYVREPAPDVSHQVIAAELYRQIQDVLDGTKWQAFIAPLDVRLPKSTERDGDVDTVVQPDVLITRGNRKLDSRGMRGAPHWLAEVLSPSTARYDQKLKVPVYERAGVREVWLVDFKDRSVAIYRLSKGRYGPPVQLKLEGETALAVVAGVTIRWEAIVKRVLSTGWGAT